MANADSLLRSFYNKFTSFHCPYDTVTQFHIESIVMYGDEKKKDIFYEYCVYIGTSSIVWENFKKCKLIKPKCPQPGHYFRTSDILWRKKIGHYSRTSYILWLRQQFGHFSRTSNILLLRHNLDTIPEPSTFFRLRQQVGHYTRIS